MKYDCDIDLNVKNNSHTQLLQRVQRHSRVLELGCATGYLTAYLTHELGCRVTAVEIDSEAAEQARPHCEQLIIANVEEADWLQDLTPASFDLILCADIIEHLKEPQRLLQRLKPYLDREGTLLTSIPNAAHASIRLELLEGRLSYEERGLLDRTHLHLYTHDALHALFTSAGYQLNEVSYTFHDLSDTIISQRLERVGLTPTPQFLNRLHAPDAVAFQFIISATPQTAATTAPFQELSDNPLLESVEVYRNLLAALHEERTTRIAHLQIISDKDSSLEKQRRQISELAANNDQLKNRIEALEMGHHTLWALQQHLRRLQQQITLARIEHQAALHEAEMLQQGITAMQASRGWRLWMALTAPLTRLRSRHTEITATTPQPPPPAVAATPQRSANYEEWIGLYEPLDPAYHADIANAILNITAPPLISIIMPVYNPEPAWLQGAIDSVIAQSWPFWQLCIVDDASSDWRIREILEQVRQQDPRIKVAYHESNQHICHTSNRALKLAEGAFIALMDHDDLLAPHALYEVAKVILDHPEAALIYSDEDKIADHGVRCHHYFKPDFNLDLLRSHNMICHLGVYRRELVEELGGFRPGFEGAQDYDLALRVVDSIKPEQIQHIPRILYHWRLHDKSTATSAAAKPYALLAAIKAMQEHLQRRQETATVSESPRLSGTLRVRYALPQPPPLVSLIIPTHNGLHLLIRLLETLREKTSYPNYEIIVVDNNSDDPVTLSYLANLQQQQRITLLHYPKPFNYSAINNFAVSHSHGEVLAFLNNDLEITDGGWLEEMVSHALRPEIGAVGARLLYPDGRLQHAGVVLGLGGVAGHAMKYFPGDSKGYCGRAVLVQNYSAVTAACLVIRREIFTAVGGFDEVNLPVAFNDIDLSLRIGEAGYRNLWTPFAELIHHESASRGADDTPEKVARFRTEVDYMLRRWQDKLPHDPAYNPNLTLAYEDFSLK
ncbi:MAG: glycosyltransferase [Gammaproteobacteria bacterium]|nr:glycosyltransferase [Gammaproteobacteria bacterium]